jgi:hypothetical protein
MSEAPLAAAEKLLGRHRRAQRIAHVSLVIFGSVLGLYLLFLAVVVPIHFILKWW